MDDYIDFTDDIQEYEEDDGFESYVQTTIDPGASMFIFTAIFCIGSLVALPFLVVLGNRRSAERKARRKERECERNKNEPSSRTTTPEPDDLQRNKNKNRENERIANDACHYIYVTNDLLDGDEDDLSIFSMLEKDMCDDKSTQGDESDTFCCGDTQTDNIMSDILQTPFCCVGPDMKTVELAPISPSRNKKRKLDENTFVSDFPPQHDEPPLEAKRRSSLSVSTDNDDSPPRWQGRRNKRTRRKILRKFKSMTKSTPMMPQPITVKVPKTTPLDGGFFGQRKTRSHGVINEKQIRREEKRDKPRNEAEECCNCLEDTFCVEVQIGCGFDNETVNATPSVGPFVGPSVDPSVDRSQSDEQSLSSNMGLDEPCGGLFEIAYFTSRVFNCDAEFRRLMALMLPCTVTSILSKIFEGIDIALISWRLGTESLAAYAVSDYIVELTFQTLRGFTDAQATLCSHALGAGNYHLTGQYVQLSLITSVLCGILLAFFVDTFTYDILVWLDMSADIANIGQQWAAVAAWAGVLNGINEAFFQFMNVIDTEMYSSVIIAMMSAINTFGIAVSLLNEDATLYHVALVKLGTVVLFNVINFVFMSWKGWLDLCWSGLVGSLSFTNGVAIKQVMKTGVPLSLGSIAREIEGLVLVIFASEMGAAEVATFTIVRTLWDIFASCMEGICCAAEIRCAYFIGTGNISMARISSYKSVVIGTTFGALLTWGFYELFEDQVKLFTRDVTLQEMMLDLVPLICIGNMTMATGMLCWSLIGAQGRFRLATLITFISGWFITIPLAAFFVFVLHINLQGLVSAVTIGYSVSGTALMYLLIRSNWNKRVEKVKRATVIEPEDNEETQEEEYDMPVEVLMVEKVPSCKVSDHTHSCSDDEECEESTHEVNPQLGALPAPTHQLL